MRTKIAAIVSGVTAFLGWFITLTPEQQTATIAPIINLIPVPWQSTIGVWLKIISAASGVYTVFRLRNMHPPDAPNINKP